MKTVEVHEVQFGLVDRIVVRRALLDDGHDSHAKTVWEIDLLGVAKFTRVSITPNGDDSFSVSVNQQISEKTARLIA